MTSILEVSRWDARLGVCGIAYYCTSILISLCQFYYSPWEIDPTNVFLWFTGIAQRPQVWIPVLRLLCTLASITYTRLVKKQTKKNNVILHCISVFLLQIYIALFPYSFFIYNLLIRKPVTILIHVVLLLRESTDGMISLVYYFGTTLS